MQNKFPRLCHITEFGYPTMYYLIENCCLYGNNGSKWLSWIIPPKVLRTQLNVGWRLEYLYHRLPWICSNCCYHNLILFSLIVKSQDFYNRKTRLSQMVLLTSPDHLIITPVFFSFLLLSHCFNEMFWFILINCLFIFLCFFTQTFGRYECVLKTSVLYTTIGILLLK